MKFLLLIYISLSLSTVLRAQKKSSQEFQSELNQQYADTIKSPLTKEGLKKFKELPFFKIDEKYIVNAHFEKADKSTPFKMKTTTNRLPSYVNYGVASFEIDGKAFLLNLYQNEIVGDNEYKDYLFLPFTDATNGNDSYGGGRFLDLKIPDGDRIEIDFNKAYNPYCAYNHAYSCPIPPRENDLDIRIEAGVKYESK